MLVQDTYGRAAEGIMHLGGCFATPADAWKAAWEAAGAVADEGALEVIGDFEIPPRGGPPSRDFQTLHIDFGLPLVPLVPGDVARVTALHVPAGWPSTHAVTRLVPLTSLLTGAGWPPEPGKVVERFVAYGLSHGARDDAAGYVEGSLARIVEAALGGTPVLPSVKTEPGFRCGAEFASVEAELEFFAQRGLDPEAVGIEVCIRPGELLVFDNLALAHGRRGIRRPGELRQRVFGHRALPVDRQIELRDRVLAAFDG